MNRVAFDFGIIQIYWYSIFVFLGAFFALGMISREAKRVSLDENKITDMLLNTLIVGIIGARLYFVVFNFSYYKNNLLEILEIWNGGLAIHGGIIFGMAYIFYFTKKHKLNFFKHLDVSSLGLILGQAIGRWGNFFNQEAFGSVTTLSALEKQKLPKFIIEGMKVDGLYRQPTFLYESIWNLIGFIILYILRKNKYIKTGTLTAVYLIWYSLGRIVIEAMRTDSLMLGPIRVAQLISALAIAMGGYIIFRNSKLAKLDKLYNGSEVKETVVQAKTKENSDSNKYKVKKFSEEKNLLINENDAYGEKDSKE